MKVLSTKQLDDRAIDYAKKLGLGLLCEAFTRVKEAEVEISSIQPGQFDAVVFTSANAVKFFFAHPGAHSAIADESIFSLSGRTADELLKHDIQPAITGINADTIARLIIETVITKSVMHVCGNLTLDILEQKLVKAGIAYSPLVVYETLLQPDIVIAETFDAVMFFSPSAIESYLTNNKLSANTVCCCIGATTAAALMARFADAKIIFPRKQSPESMLDALAHYFKTGKRND